MGLSCVLPAHLLHLAEVVGKRHDNVMRDIEVMMQQLSTNSDLRRLETGCSAGSYKDRKGQSRRCFILDKEHVECLITGYDAALRMKMIRHMRSLEAQLGIGIESDASLNLVRALSERPKQIECSKDINGHLAEQGRADEIPAYHRSTRRGIVGKTKAQIKQWADANLPHGPRGGKPSKRMSVREQTRHMDPASACGFAACDMAYINTDNLPLSIETGKQMKHTHQLLAATGLLAGGVA